MDEFNALLAVMRAAESGNGLLVDLSLRHYKQVDSLRRQSVSWTETRRV